MNSSNIPIVKPDIGDVDVAGKLWEKGTLFLKEDIGEARGPDGSYKLYLLTGSSIPCVVSSFTGKTYTLDWKDLIELALQKGIDK